MPDLPEDVTVRALELIDRRDKVMERLQALASFEIQSFKIRIHGDYHLGRVLRVKNDYVIVHFEGEPGQPLAERRAKASPLKDVATMKRSFSYAAQVALFHHANRRADESQRLREFAALWERQTSSLFLKAYRQAMTDARLLPGENDLRKLLDIFLLDKAFSELQYEIKNRPHWINIPLHGLLGILGEGNQFG